MPGARVRAARGQALSRASAEVSRAFSEVSRVKHEDGILQASVAVWATSISHKYAMCQINNDNTTMIVYPRFRAKLTSGLQWCAEAYSTGTPEIGQKKGARATPFPLAITLMASRFDARDRVFS